MKDLRKFIATTIREYLNENKQLQKIVYHTSNEYFNYFNTNKISNIRGDLYGKGFYITERKTHPSFLRGWDVSDHLNKKKQKYLVF